VTADPRDAVVSVIRPGDLSADTAQSLGIVRSAAIDATSVGAQRLWVGRAVCPPKMLSDPHHHGGAETGSYVLGGRFQVYFGENYEHRVECVAGDFCFIPAYLPHIEANPFDEPSEVVFARSPDNIVVTLEPVDFTPWVD
jgi:uncharacterized RmlC-like cupin family protein